MENQKNKIKGGPFFGYYVQSRRRFVAFALKESPDFVRRDSTSGDGGVDLDCADFVRFVDANLQRQSGFSKQLALERVCLWNAQL